MNSILSLTTKSMLDLKKKKKSQLVRHSKYVYWELLPLRDSGQAQLPELTSCWSGNTECPGGSHPRRGLQWALRIPSGCATRGGEWARTSLLLLSHPPSQHASSPSHTSALSIIQPTTLPCLPKIKPKKLILERTTRPCSIPIFWAQKPTEKQDTQTVTAQLPGKCHRWADLWFDISTFIKGQCLTQPHENMSFSGEGRGQKGRGQKERTTEEDNVHYNILRSNRFPL